MKRQTGRLVDFALNVPPGIPPVFTEQARGLVLGMSLDEHDVGLAHVTRGHTPSNGIGLDGDSVSGTLESLGRHGAHAGMGQGNLRRDPGTEWVCAIYILREDAGAF